MKRAIISSAILSVLSFGAMADTPSFDFVEIGYTQLSIDGTSIEPDGFEFRGSSEINDSWYIAGDYSDISDGGASVSLTTAGVGFKNDFSDTSSFFAEIDFARFDTNGGGSDSGYEMTFGVRSNITEKLELKGAIEYLDINDDDTTYLVLGAAYNFTDRLAVYSDYKNESDSDRFSVGVRFRF